MKTHIVTRLAKLSFILLTFCGAAECLAGQYQFVKEIPIGGEGGWDYLSIDSAAHRLYVTHATKIVDHDIKVMKRIEPRELAIEGVITRHGTLVGPLMAELTGFPELTPYDGGWCGNDVSPELLTEEQRRTARERTVAMGERLRKEGYRGYFELDFLLDEDTGKLYLGEVNPRITGAPPDPEAVRTSGTPSPSRSAAATRMAGCGSDGSADPASEMSAIRPPVRPLNTRTFGTPAVPGPVMMSATPSPSTSPAATFTPERNVSS